MRKSLAIALALAVLAPGPSFAANLRAVEPIRTVSLPSAPVGLAQLPALTGVAPLPAAAVPAAPSVPSLPSAPVSAAAPAGPAAVAIAVAAAPQARPQAAAPRAAAPNASALRTASRIAAAAPAESAAELDRAYDLSSHNAGDAAAAAVTAAPPAPRRSGLTRRVVRAGALLATGATLLISQGALAMPDGMVDWKMRQAANSGATAVNHPAVHAAASSGSSAWMGVALIAAFIGGVVGLVLWMRWKDNRQERMAGDPSRFDPGSSSDITDFSPGGHVGTAGHVMVPPSGKGKKGEAVEQKRPIFADVAGQDEAKTELAEIVDYLKNPAEYKKLHPRYKGPKGVLMFGPPGTGKTLLARAVANEANVPFVHKAGSDFINTYVGKGADNIRQAFEEVRKQIKEKGGAGILFIDEIEAIGGARTGNSDRSEETRTINALLKEMDGFEKDNIIVIAATNLPESLDPALVRGGRFGTKVPVGKPDVVGRKKVFDIHLAGAKLAEDVDSQSLAKQTPGLAGADIEQIVMDSVKLAKRRGAAAIAQQDLIKAIDEFTTGKQRNLVMSKREKEIVAFHESGHALVSHLLPDADPVRKVTIIPHGLNALGFMQAMPEEEKVLYSYEWLVDRIAVALGGRVAEKMMTGRVYSGAANDLQQATRMAKLMVMQFGMSDEIGHVSYDMEGERPAVGGPMSEETRKKIDAEVRRVVQDALKRVETLLAQHRPALEAMAQELMEKETLTSEDMERIIKASKGGAGKTDLPRDSANEHDGFKKPGDGTNG